MINYCSLIDIVGSGRMFGNSDPHEPKRRDFSPQLRVLSAFRKANAGGDGTLVPSGQRHGFATSAVNGVCLLLSSYT